MNIVDKINELLGIDDSYKAPSSLMNILKDKTKREKVFMEFLELFDKDVTYDWFNLYFQEEHADRKNKKQDFTPPSVGKLLTALMNDPEIQNWNTYEPCAGTGGLTIQAWNRDRMNHSPFDFKPSWYFYTCEEISERAIPFLLFNLMIRGMNAVVIHCDVLSRNAKGAWFIQNDNDDHMMFSNLYLMPYNESTAKHLGVIWEDETVLYKNEFDVPGGLPKHIFGEVTLEDLKRMNG